MNKTAIAAVRRVDSRILYLRDQKIILDVDLAELYRELMAPTPRNGRKIGFQPASAGTNPKSSLHLAKFRGARVPILAN
jgi:hypothetical protein